MQRIMILPLLILCYAAVTEAEVYTWTDDQGVVTYTDNAARIPSRYSGQTKEGEKITIHRPKAQKEYRGSGKKRPQAAIPRNRLKALQPGKQYKTVPLENQAEIKGHLGGDQTDPTPPSMKQPKPQPLGVQPAPATAGMKQPTPAPLGDQPKATPAGMKQPIPASLGEQPKPTPLGMEQPEPKL
ncbi:MAG: DUF4124 domain-containing protein [Desulfuromonadales bacterium]|nr:DUF4124 domain-containing protein [Desulfuromonadales bacterium]